MNNTLSFSKIEFLLILVSIVYGFCIVDLFDNWARMLRRSVYYWETTTWSIILFLCIAFLWYNAWDNVGRIAETSVNYVLALLPPICFFVLTSLLFPDKTSQETLKAAWANAGLANNAISCDSSSGRLLKKAVAPMGWSGELPPMIFIPRTSL